MKSRQKPDGPRTPRSALRHQERLFCRNWLTAPIQKRRCCYHDYSWCHTSLNSHKVILKGRYTSGYVVSKTQSQTENGSGSGRGSFSPMRRHKMCFSSATGTTVTVSCRYLQFPVAQWDFVTGRPAMILLLFFDCQTGVGPKNTFKLWHGEQTMQSRVGNTGGFDDRKREKVSPLVTHNVFFLLFFWFSH